MKTIIFSTVLSFLLTTLGYAQGKSIQPLKCGTWGEENWSAYSEADLARKAYPGPVDLQKYYEYESTNNILYLSRNYDGYINNVQAIRWSLEETEEPFIVTVSENRERIILYEAQTKGCGLIFFPDSLMKYKSSTLEIVVEQKGEPMMFITFDAEFKAKRKTLLKELTEAGSINEQVGLLIQKQKYREALTLLEIERLHKPYDEELRNLYWRTASRIRLCPLQYPPIDYNFYPKYSTTNVNINGSYPPNYYSTYR